MMPSTGIVEGLSMGMNEFRHNRNEELRGPQRNDMIMGNTLG